MNQGRSAATTNHILKPATVANLLKVKWYKTNKQRYTEQTFKNKVFYSGESILAKKFEKFYDVTQTKICPRNKQKRKPVKGLCLYFNLKDHCPSMLYKHQWCYTTCYTITQ